MDDIKWSGAGDPDSWDAGDGDSMSIQDLIDSGMAWRLEGHVGRQCMGAIEAGDAMLGPRPVRDFYGNLIPAWWMVEEGTKGSPEFAGLERPVEPSAAERAKLLKAVGVSLSN